MSFHTDTVGAVQTFLIKIQQTITGGQTCAPPPGSLRDCHGDMLILLQDAVPEKGHALSTVRVGSLQNLSFSFPPWEKPLLTLKPKTNSNETRSIPNKLREEKRTVHLMFPSSSR